MSYKTNGTITCPHCGTKHNKIFWGVINEQENPQIASRVRNGNLFIHRCKNCGKESAFIYPLVYVSEKDNYNIHVVKNGIDEAAISAAITYEKQVDPSMQMRIVHNIDELIEKTSILRNHLDDRIVEIMKISILEHMDDPTRLFVGPVRFVSCVINQNKNFDVMVYGKYNNKAYTVMKDMYDYIKNKVEKSLEIYQYDSAVIDLTYAIEFLDNNHFVIK